MSMLSGRLHSTAQHSASHSMSLSCETHQSRNDKFVHPFPAHTNGSRDGTCSQSVSVPMNSTPMPCLHDGTGYCCLDQVKNAVEPRPSPAEPSKHSADDACITQSVCLQTSPLSCLCPAYMMALGTVVVFRSSMLLNPVSAQLTQRQPRVTHYLCPKPIPDAAYMMALGTVALIRSSMLLKPVSDTISCSSAGVVLLWRGTKLQQHMHGSSTRTVATCTHRADG